MTTDTAAAPPAVEEPVLDDQGRFHAVDAPIDLSNYRWEDWLTLGFFLLLALDVFYQFFTRYVLSDSAAWTEEIARYLLIVVTFLGCSMAMRRNAHIQVEFVYRWLPAPVARVLATFVDVVKVSFLAYATWLTIELIPRMHNLQMTIVDFPMSYVYALVGLGFGMTTLRAAQVARRNWRQGWSILERPGEQFEA